MLDEMQVVGDHQDRDAAVIVQMMQQSVEREAAANVHAGERFVEQEQVGVVQQRVGDEDALKLAAGEPPETAIDQMLRPDLGQLHSGLRADGFRAGIEPRARFREAQREKFRDRERQRGIERELLRHVPDLLRVRLDPSARQWHEARDGFHQRAFSSTVWPDHARKIAATDFQCDASQHFRVTVSDVQVFDFE